MFTLGRVSPRAILATGAGPVHKLLADAKGVTVQEEGAQVVGLSLGVRAGDRVLDACAGRGNKTGLFVQQAGESGIVDASDVHPQKLDRLREELAKLGRAPHATFAADLSRGTGAIKGPYDRIMVDAPCSGTGTLRRRPDIFRARAEESIAELAALQKDIVQNTSRLLAPGGKLVFAVCSVLREEAEDVVAAVLATDPTLSAAPFDSELDVLRDRTQLRLTPAEHGTDGYFMACFVRLDRI
jgi:16S rRNA (cytosine967-C5)-methyltransferase